MNGAYPPGVTGNEPEIVGSGEIDWDEGTFEPTDRIDVHTEEGTVEGWRGNVRYIASATRCCDEIEIDEESAEFDAVLEG